MYQQLPLELHVYIFFFIFTQPLTSYDYFLNQGIGREKGGKDLFPLVYISHNLAIPPLILPSMRCKTQLNPARYQLCSLHILVAPKASLWASLQVSHYDLSEILKLSLENVPLGLLCSVSSQQVNFLQDKCTNSIPLSSPPFC